MHLVRARAAVLVALLAPTSLGCASSYVPRPGPHVAMVQDSNGISFVRDGVKYDGGPFGGDVEEAVAGDPRAEEYARQYKSGLTTGFVMSMVGLVGIVGGSSLIGAEAAQTSSSSSAVTAGAITFGAGLLLEIIGVSIAAKAQTHLYDAVNVYNDDVDAGRIPPPAAP